MNALRDRVEKALQDRCGRAQTLAMDNGGLTIGRWIQRQADTLWPDTTTADERETKRGTFESWYYGAKPNLDNIELLIGLFGASFRNEIFPSPDDTGSYQDGANDTIERMISHLQEQRDNGGGA